MVSFKKALSEALISGECNPVSFSDLSTPSVSAFTAERFREMKLL